MITSLNIVIGPLTWTHQKEGRWPNRWYYSRRTYAVGVVSFDVAGCGHRKYPGVYARIAAVKPWIDRGKSKRYMCPPYD